MIKPIWNIPSLGAIPAGSSRLVVVVLMLASWVFVLPLLMMSPYAVIVAGAWAKSPRRVWRSGVVVSIVLAVILTILASPLYVPAGLPIPLPTGDTDSWPATAGLTGCIVLINSLLVAGVALLPLSAASTIATVVSRRKVKPATSAADVSSQLLKQEDRS